MNVFALQERDSSIRWVVCLLVVLLAHGAAGVFLLSRQPSKPPEVVQAAMFIDLAPLPTPEPAETPAEPTPPEPVALELPPPELPPEPVIQPPPPPVPLEIPPPEAPPELVLEPPPAPVKPAVPLPLPSPKPPPSRRPTPPREAAPRPMPVEPPPAAAPPAAASAAPSPAAAANWQSRLLAHLKRYMRYPPAAQMRRQEGVALLWFRMTPSGEVLAFRLERSSGHPLLDQETLDLIKRAQPLPALPPDMPQQPIELVQPLRYELR